MMDDQKILDNAPKDATHIDIELAYWDIRSCNDHPLVWDDEKWFATDDIPTAFAFLRPLADIRELVELRKANAELEKGYEELRMAALWAVQLMSGGQAKADLRDAYDKSTEQLEALKAGN
jgi:hypothetical protein